MGRTHMVGLVLVLVLGCNDEGSPLDLGGRDGPPIDAVATADGPRSDAPRADGAGPDAARDSSLPDLAFVPDAWKVTCVAKDGGGFDCKSSIPCKTAADCPTIAPVKCPGSWQCEKDLCHYHCI